MDFRKRKLPIEAAPELRVCPIDTVKPFALMIAPVYVLMKRNEKYVSVKAPLDFFVPEELDKLRGFEVFFMPEFIESAVPYRSLARRVKMLLVWHPNPDALTLPPAPFEISDAVLRLMAPLWGGGQGIESFFVTVFVNEFCALLPGEELQAARDRDLRGLERAVILSSWMVFLSLHTGVTDLNYLNALRLKSFRKLLGTHPGDEGIPRLENHGEAGELFELLEQLLLGETVYGSLALEQFERRNERVAQKIASRIQRVNSELEQTAPLTASIHGEGGFADG